MATRTLTAWNDELFRKISRPVTKFDDRLHTLLDDMAETLEKTGGYGCAAVHCGVLRRVVVVLAEDGTIELVNPVVTEQSAETAEIFEGSVAPGAPWGFVPRPVAVTVSAHDRNGNPLVRKAEGFLAATFCHEIDHLDGVLFADKATKLVKDPKEIERILGEA